MTKEELLAEARRRYPIGTRFKCVNGNTPSEDNQPIIEEYTEFNYMSRRGGGSIWINHNQWIYLNEEWAEIITNPEPEYQIY